MNSGALFSSGNFQMRGSEFFPDPFLDMASTHMPESPRDVLRWCEFLWSKQGLYREAMRRVLSYFVTDVEIVDPKASRSEKKKYLEYLNDEFDVRSVLFSAGEDYLCYGNYFGHTHADFLRYLSCRKCKAIELPLRVVYNDPRFAFEWRDCDFHVTCPKCQFRGPWSHNDRRAKTDPIKLLYRSPHEIEIIYDPYTHGTDYIWKIPDDYARTLLGAKPPLKYLENARWEVIQAVKNRQYLQYDPDVLFHMKDRNLAGIRNRGWGIPKMISLFGQAWYVQVLHRFNEAIALDYVVPFRVLTPMPRSGGSDAASVDPVVGADLGNFRARVEAMLAARRKDPARWNVLPFPIQYQAMGGEATALAPKDLLDQGIDNLLASAGVPVDLYRGTLTVQAAPMCLRLFESNWTSLTHNLNRLLRFISQRISQQMDWSPVNLRLMKTTMADDIQKQTNILALMGQRQVSQTTGLAAVGRDFEEEQRRLLEEEQFIAEETEKMQETMENKQQMQQAVAGGGAAGAGGGAAGAGGAAPGGGGAGGAPTANQPVTLQELSMKAQEIAQRLSQMGESQKDSELLALRKANPSLASIVKDQLAQFRQQTNTQGGAQLRDQMFGKAGQAPLAVPATREVPAITRRHRQLWD